MDGLGGMPAWEVQAGGITVFVTPLAHDESALVAGTASAADVRSVASQALPMVDHLLPLASS